MVVRSYKDYLQDILDAMNKSQSFVSGMDYEAFKNDDKTTYVVIRTLKDGTQAYSKKRTISLLRVHESLWCGQMDTRIHAPS